MEIAGYLGIAAFFALVTVAVIGWARYVRAARRCDEIGRALADARTTATRMADCAAEWGERARRAELALARERRSEQWLSDAEAAARRE